jgi:peptide/nickel transport system substrate-binding protein
VKRTALFIKCNDLVCGDHAVIPIMLRPRVRGASTKLATWLSGWDLDFAQLQNWYRET